MSADIHTPEELGETPGDHRVCGGDVWWAEFLFSLPPGYDLEEGLKRAREIVQSWKE